MPDIDLGFMLGLGSLVGLRRITKTTGSRVWHLEGVGQWLFTNCMEIFH